MNIIKNKERILLTVDYSDNTRKFWRDSYIKRSIFWLDGDIHAVVKKAIEETDGVELSYKGKPITNIFRDQEDGTAKPVGYIYRAKDEIDGKKAFFDVWVTINKVEDYPIKELI